MWRYSVYLGFRSKVFAKKAIDCIAFSFLSVHMCANFSVTRRDWDS